MYIQNIEGNIGGTPLEGPRRLCSTCNMKRIKFFGSLTKFSNLNLDRKLEK
jgi:hypothetical protein